MDDLFNLLSLSDFFENKDLIYNISRLEKSLEKIKKYLLERSQHDFYYIGKKAIKELKLK